jgi:hypothetical protein
MSGIARMGQVPRQFTPWLTHAPPRICREVDSLEQRVNPLPGVRAPELKIASVMAEYRLYPLVDRRVCSGLAYDGYGVDGKQKAAIDSGLCRGPDGVDI